MPRIIACQPDGVAVADLGGIGRLGLAGASWQGSPAFALSWSYPPSPAVVVGPQGQLVSMAPYSQLSLVRCAVSVAQTTEEISKVAAAAMQGGSAEEAERRTQEAMELFKNLPRIRHEVLAACTTDVQAVLHLYWAVRGWLAEGFTEKKTVSACDHTLVLLP